MKDRLQAARWPALVALAALMPRLFELGNRPLWLDEVYTLQRVSLKPAALVQDSLTNHHLPGFFLMLWPLVGLGNPQFWLRLPPAIFGALSVMLVFIIATRIAGRLAGVVAALVLGFSPMALAFSQEARSYTLEMTLILVALYGIVRLAMDLPAASTWGRGSLTGWVCYTLGSAAAVDVLGDGLPWVLVANVIGLVLVAQSPCRISLLRNFFVADLVILACCAPFYWLLTMYKGQGYVASVMWIPPLTGSRLWYDVGSVYLMRVADWVTFRFMDVPTPPVVIWVIDVALLMAVAVAAWVLRRRPALLVVLGVSFVALPVMAAIVSLWRPILLPRYILWSAAPFAILAGVGASAVLERFTPRLRALAVGFGVVLLLMNMAPYYQAETKPRWDVAARMLAKDVQPGDVVYLYDTAAVFVLKVYLPPGTQTVVLNDSNGNLDHARQAIAQGRRVWAVYGHVGQSGEEKALTNFFGGARRLGEPKLVQVAGKRIVIALYEPGG